MPRFAPAAAALALLCAPPAARAEGGTDCAVTGTAAYAPPLSLRPAATDYALELDLDCVGDPAEAGLWRLELAGATNGGYLVESCAYGFGYGRLVATGPHGDGVGFFQVQRRAWLVELAGDVESGGHSHQFALDLALTPRKGGDCVSGVGAARLTGTGFFGRI